LESNFAIWQQYRLTYTFPALSTASPSGVPDSAHDLIGLPSLAENAIAHPARVVVEQVRATISKSL
jgi:hypothetical protein